MWERGEMAVAVLFNAGRVDNKLVLNSGRVNLANYKKIEKGMAEKEVLDLLGPPLLPDVPIQGPGPGGKAVRGAVWSGKNLVVHVAFADARVIDKRVYRPRR
jgi:hypothetical protein